MVEVAVAVAVAVGVAVGVGIVVGVGVEVGVAVAVAVAVAVGIVVMNIDIEMPARVRLDPDYSGFNQQVIGWAADRVEGEEDCDDWVEYIRADIARPKVKSLVWQDFDGRGAKASAFYRANYLITKWSDGRFELSISYPGYSHAPNVDSFYPTIETAKYAAQADHELRILSLLEGNKPPTDCGLNI